jgi:hypothetical protein
MPTFKIGDLDENNKMWYWDKAPDITRLCTIIEGDGLYTCPNDLTCGSPTHASSLNTKDMSLSHNWTLPLYQTEDVENDDMIAYNISNFNNLLWAMVTIFVMITLEGWSLVMYNLADSSVSYMAYLFCMLLVIIGSFFLLNVILAVIMDSFDRVDSM